MKLNRFLTLSAMLALAAVSSLAQGQSPLGRIIGKVTDGMTKEPIVGANVVVAGTGLGSATDIEGRFDIRRVPLGTYAAWSVRTYADNAPADEWTTLLGVMGRAEDPGAAYLRRALFYVLDSGASRSAVVDDIGESQNP